ncbi:MAG: ATP-dependent DNA helicase RecG [Candidatus Pacebacteria bacterium]|nr:ATP-dependent DNA helicase RecG [Candidatus Paceibacterota bacterium]
MNLDTPVLNLMGVARQQSLKHSFCGLGPFVAKKLNKLGIKTLGDLIYHLPFRYEDFSNITPIAKLKPANTEHRRGISKSQATLGFTKKPVPNEIFCIKGIVKDIETTKAWKKQMEITTAIVEDETGAIKAVWFNQPFMEQNLHIGNEVYLAGKVKLGKTGLFLSSPIYEISKYQNSEMSSLNHTGRVVPIYQETIGLTSRWFRNFFAKNLPQIIASQKEFLPQEILKQHNLLPFSQALYQAHFPDSMEMAQKAKNRFAFEELFLIELFVLRERMKINQQKSPSIPILADEIKKFVDSLPFKLTDSQKKCAWQILKDTEKTNPMSRLLEGDVGSGKTLVALIGALNCFKNGYQSAIMAPTEILATQHFKTAAILLRKSKIKIALLTGKKDEIISQKLGYEKDGQFMPETIEISRTKVLEKTRRGEINLLIGTHALIQDKVKFGNLGLVVVDEQHRFGVAQRAKLCQKTKTFQGLIPHLLSMTATPIPRTLALTIYGDLDLSLLDQMPQGRKPIITKIFTPDQREQAYEFIKEHLKKGEQCFIICPRIEKKETPDNEPFKKNIWTNAKTVKEEYEKLSKEIFPKFKVAFIHGKLKVGEKEKIMRDFKNNKTQILVSTSVVEVGVDIPQATIILIEGAEHFGLAQIHQFRGRVGRNDIQSYCFLFADSPSKNTKARLSAIIKAKNGFELAEKDLEIRGPGSLIGDKQWGISDIAMANLNNLQLIETTRTEARALLTKDPFLRQYTILSQKIANFGEKIHLE